MDYNKIFVVCILTYCSALLSWFIVIVHGHCSSLCIVIVVHCLLGHYFCFLLCIVVHLYCCVLSLFMVIIDRFYFYLLFVVIEYIVHCYCSS